MRHLLCWLLLAGLAAPASAGHFDGRVGVDFLRANAFAEGTGVGTPADLRYHEIGMSLRLDLRELDDDLRVRVDYRGREALPGEILGPNERLLYEAQASYALLDKQLVLGAGRFLAPAALFLPVDGGFVEGHLPGDVTLRAYGGRRAITSSRRNLDIEHNLPAVGGSARWTLRPYIDLEVSGGWAQDQALAAVQSGSDLRRRYGAGHLRAFAHSHPVEGLRLGAQVAFLQRAAYLVGPTWREWEVQAEAFDLFVAGGFAEYRPWHELRVRADVQAQRPASYRLGRVDATGDVTPEVLSPEFIDARARVSWGPWELGWLRAGYRLRLRPDRTEHRYAVQLDADDLHLFGLFARGALAFDDIVHHASFTPDPHDDNRIMWSAALGYKGYGLEVEAGASFLERTAGPVSGRLLDPLSPDEPRVAGDLAPFTLGAQRVIFARAFFAHEWVFAGVDFERNLQDDEYRVMVQIGGQVEASW